MASTSWAESAGDPSVVAVPWLYMTAMVNRCVGLGFIVHLPLWACDGSCDVDSAVEKLWYPWMTALDLLILLTFANGCRNVWRGTRNGDADRLWPVVQPLGAAAFGVAAAATRTVWVVALTAAWQLHNALCTAPALGVAGLRGTDTPIRLLGAISMNNFIGIDIAAKVAAAIICGSDSSSGTVSLVLAGLHISVGFVANSGSAQNALHARLTHGRAVFLCAKSVFFDAPLIVALLTHCIHWHHAHSDRELSVLLGGVVTSAISVLLSIRYAFAIHVLSSERDAETNRLRNAVATAEAVAEALAEFDLGRAEELVKGDGAVPLALRDAMIRQLDNLKAYRPYLPDSLFQSDEPAVTSSTPPLTREPTGTSAVTSGSDKQGAADATASMALSRTETDAVLRQVTGTTAASSPQYGGAESPLSTRQQGNVFVFTVHSSPQPGQMSLTTPRGLSPSYAGSRAGPRVSSLPRRLQGPQAGRHGSAALCCVRLVLPRGQSSAADLHAVAYALDTHNVLAAAMIDAAKSTRAVVERMAETRALASLGAQGQNMGRAAAATGACRLCLRVTQLCSIPCSAGVATGSALSGFVGTDALKGRFVLGPAKFTACRFSQLALVLRCTAIACGSTVAAAHHEFVFRQVDMIRSESGTQVLHQLLGANTDEQRNTEWMYALQACADAHKADPLTSALDALVDGDVQLAQRRASDPASGEDEALQRLRDALRARREEPPLAASARLSADGMRALSTSCQSLPTSAGAASMRQAHAPALPVPYRGRRVFDPVPGRDFEVFAGEVPLPGLAELFARGGADVSVSSIYSASQGGEGEGSSDSQGNSQSSHLDQHNAADRLSPIALPTTATAASGLAGPASTPVACMPVVLPSSAGVSHASPVTDLPVHTSQGSEPRLQDLEVVHNPLRGPLSGFARCRLSPRGHA
eukprot:TRINITY_DN9851_c0_g1_i2.p1 TRINITY_DN9851_c0_g1~~TRINITY_DN9851_c0_g1_i2.p1  ORF type:complete len:955 (+),score=161.88 TRINITY_DN9851_c0_g1_i2:85-2865(+)